MYHPIATSAVVNELYNNTSVQYATAKAVRKTAVGALVHTLGLLLLKIDGRRAKKKERPPIAITKSCQISGKDIANLLSYLTVYASREAHSLEQ